MNSCIRLMLLVGGVCFTSLLSADEIGINIYGLSYHPDRKDSSGRTFNEFNPGVGLNYIALEKSRGIFQLDAAIFKNSGGKATQYIGAGYRYKIGRGFSAGGEFVYFHSSTYNNGDGALGMIPLVAYRRNLFSFNFMYLPKYKNINRNSAFGLYGTIHLRKMK